MSDSFTPRITDVDGDKAIVIPLDAVLFFNGAMDTRRYGTMKVIARVTLDDFAEIADDDHLKAVIRANIRSAEERRS